MAIPSSDLLGLAQRLRASPDEAERRTSTSRLYYGMLHFTIECLERQSAGFTRRPSGSRYNTYWVVRTALVRSEIEDSRHALTRLDALKTMREGADYDVDLGDWRRGNIEQAEAHARAVARVLGPYHPEGAPVFP